MWPSKQKHVRESNGVAEKLEDRVTQLEQFNRDLMSLTTVLRDHLEEFSKDDVD
jgi:hypothetical protein